jgi:hypothetical protein
MRVSLHKHEHTVLKLLSERDVLLALTMSLPMESESFYPLSNFENDDSGLAVKCYSVSGLIPLVFTSVRHFYRHRHHSVR